MELKEATYTIRLPNQIDLFFAECKQTKPRSQSMEDPCIILVHGWPDFHFGWRHQMKPLASEGYRVIAPDLRGFGNSSCPKGKDMYSISQVASDLILLMDFLNIKKSIFIGHDWGSPVVWGITTHYPDRVIAVASLVVPYFPCNYNKNPYTEMVKNGGRYDYQMYFQEEGKAESELEKSDETIRLVLTLLLRSSKKEDFPKFNQKVSLSNVRERGGFLVGVPQDIKTSIMLSESDINKYIEAFKKSGFHGGLSYYRNIQENWEWNKKVGNTVNIPSLVIMVDRDPLFPPVAIGFMTPFVSNLRQELITGAGHFVQQEEPSKVNNILISWLKQISNNKSKL